MSTLERMVLMLVADFGMPGGDAVDFAVKMLDRMPRAGLEVVTTQVAQARRVEADPWARAFKEATAWIEGPSSPLNRPG